MSVLPFSPGTLRAHRWKDAGFLQRVTELKHQGSSSSLGSSPSEGEASSSQPPASENQIVTLEPQSSYNAVTDDSESDTNMGG